MPAAIWPTVLPTRFDAVPYGSRNLTWWSLSLSASQSKQFRKGINTSSCCIGKEILHDDEFFFLCLLIDCWNAILFRFFQDMDMVGFAKDNLHEATIDSEHDTLNLSMSSEIEISEIQTAVFTDTESQDSD
jgi:hypothetical protein